MDKNYIVKNIVVKFSNNSLLSNELKKVLNLFDIKYLKELNQVLEKYNLEGLKTADNQLNDEINLLLNNDSLSDELKDNLTKLKEAMIQLQLNVLLSYCAKKDQNVVIPLIAAINNKLDAVNNIINVTKQAKNENIINLEESNVKNELSSNENIINIEETQIHENPIVNNQINEKVKNAFEKTIIYPRLTNKSHNNYFDFVNRIIEQLDISSQRPFSVSGFIQFINEHNLIKIYGNLIFNTLPRINLADYYGIVTESKFRPIIKNDKNQAMILFKIYEALNRIINNKISDKQKQEDINIFINNFLEYWKAEADIHGKNDSIVIKGFDKNNFVVEDQPERKKMDIKSFENNMINISSNIKKNMNMINKLIGGSNKYWYYKYLKYKTKYLMLNVK